MTEEHDTLLESSGAHVYVGEGWSRRRKDPVRREGGPRPQPGRWPMVEPMEGGNMVEEELMTPGSQLTEVEQVGEEPRVETESHRARVTQRIRRAKAEQIAQVTKAQAGLRMTMVETERQKTKVEPQGAQRSQRYGGMRRSQRCVVLRRRQVNN
ncbi:putative S-adenosylmethionine-dependent methyltransferase Rv3037c [Labeo rohita]|uniref:S-adenosylmethionine-dependent methyltransferase Rv3037c n=1 Tax=Labeo rohita TaxID=84645 RepID=A0ABQ8MCA8_LABRO|nr:putative S-adenosylmethionine-dependent methyltransferase Rv3037c [Labeo rohita]